MSYSEKNKLRIYAENAQVPGDDVEDSDGIIYPSSIWETKNERKIGAVTGVADSQEFNTALRQATIGATLIAEIIAQRFELEVSSDLPSNYTDFENYITTLASKFTKTSFLYNNEVLTKHIANANITTDKIADASITTKKIADGNVTTAKIADSNVTTAKIADSNVTTAKIADSNVTKAKLNNDILNGTFSGMTAGYISNLMTSGATAGTSVELQVKSTKDGGINTLTFTF